MVVLNPGQLEENTEQPPAACIKIAVNIKIVGFYIQIELQPLKTSINLHHFHEQPETA